MDLQHATQVVLQLQALRNLVNESCKHLDPCQIICYSVLTVILARWFSAAVENWSDSHYRALVLKRLFKFAKGLPVIRDIVKKEQAKAVEKIRASLHRKEEETFSCLPKKGLSQAEVLQRMRSLAEGDGCWKEGKVSGTVYHGSDNIISFLNESYSLFSVTNPLHPDVFPSVRKFEREVVRIAASLMGGDADVCGAVTSGGTESILMAIKAARDWARDVKGIEKPELVAAVSAHAAVMKAAEYFGIKLVLVPLGPDYRADVRAMRRAITSRTIMLYASAPSYPHGMIDPVADLAAIARRRNILLHVDCCLGGFVLPFALKLGYEIPPFDFRVSGVTSVSIDTHKYGFAHKGSSVVLFRNQELRRYMYTVVTDWPGGLYISPTAPGSRPGGLIATAWAALLHFGEDGYIEAVSKMFAAFLAIKNGISSIEGLYVLGRPDGCCIAFSAHKLNIFAIHDVMRTKGWHLSPQHRPSCLHISVTYLHVDKVEALLTDLRAAVAEVSAMDPAAIKKGSAPMYGMAATLPDRQSIADILRSYMDILYS